MRALLITAVIGALVGPAAAETIPAIIGDRAGAGLPADLAITSVHLPRSLAKVDVDPTTVDVDFPAAARPGRSSVRVRLRTGKVRSVFVPVTIAALVDVAIATHPLDPGALVTTSDVRWERRAVDPRSGSSRTPLGQQVSAPISAGEVLDDSRLTAPPPIARGTELRIEVRRGAVAIVTRGRLETAARLGGPARARLAAGALVSGVLADRTRLIVEAP